MIRNVRSAFKNYAIPETSAPWLLLIACLLGFGVFIPRLGYYQDDWSFVYNHYIFGETGINDFLYYDGRPFAAWVYNFGFSILGYKPIFWHVVILVVKWLTGTFLWLAFRATWPDKSWQTLTAALIFLLYPFFTLQPLAVAYSIHWIGYMLYSLSIYLMLLSLKKQFWLFTPLALLAQVLCLFMLEYFAGIDLLRPVFLWLALRTSIIPTRPRLVTTLKRWAPYLIVSAVYFIWRGFIYEAPAGRNTPIALLSFLDHPVSSLVATGSSAIPDIVLILVSSWYKLLEPGTLDFSISINRYAFLIGVASFFIFLYSLSRLASSEENTSKRTRDMFLTGLIALLLGLLPAYAGGFVIHTKLPPWNSRFSLGSLFGAGLMITALIDAVVRIPRTRWIVVSALIALLVGWHLRSTNDFRWSWDEQVDFYRQFQLRVPYLEPGTAILAEEEFLVYMGNYSTSYGINLIYSAKEQSAATNQRKAEYWFFTYPDFSTKMDPHLNGEPFSIGTNREAPRAGITFQGEQKGTIAITFEPGLGQCLWVMRPEYARSKTLSPVMQQLASISYTERIKPAPELPDNFLNKNLYSNPEKDWCYYYEKADLASQNEDWNQVIQLWETAQQNNLGPDNGFEYLPFIEAFAHTNDWNAAKKMTISSSKTIQGLDSLLCTIWEELQKNTPDSPDKERILQSVRDDLQCNEE